MARRCRTKEVRLTAHDVTSFRAQYDAVSGAGTRRRSATIERTGEDGQGSQQLPPTVRLQMINLCRDAVRNFSSAKNLLRQLAVNVAGTEFKLRFKAKGDEYRLAEKWFNGVFAKACDFKSDRHLSDFQSLLLTSVARDGDAGLAFDRDLLQTGKLIAFEADQIADAPKLPAGAAYQVDGVAFDLFGREMGYTTTNRHGCITAPEEDFTTWLRDPDDPEDGVFTLLRMPWRFGQTRGTGELFASIADILDCYEMRSKELQTAKVVGSLAAKVTHNDSVNPNLESLFSAPTEEATEAALKNISEQAGGLANYVNLEALTGGNTVYLQTGDNAEFMDPHNRPNLNMDEFAKRVMKTAATGMGFAGCYATLEAEGSYTAFRGSLIMTWTTVRLWQKWYERHIQDWTARRALRFAMEHRLIPALPDGWENIMAWKHPLMPQVDPQKDQQAFLAAYRNGQTSLANEYGVDYAERVEEIAEEVSLFKDKGVPHPLFQTAAGAVIEETGAPEGGADEQN